MTGAMRSTVAGVLIVAGLVVAAAAVPALWVERHVVDEDGYVAFVEPLGNDPEMLSAIEQEVTESLSQGNASALSDVIGRATGAVVGRLAEGEGFRQAWAETNRSAHRSLFVDPRELPAEVDQSSRLAIDLAPIAQLVLDQVNERGGTDLTAPDRIMLTIGGSDERQLVDRLRVLDPGAYVLVGAALLLLAGGVLVGRRRSTTLAWVGLGLLAVAGFLRVVGDEAVPRVVSRNTAPSFSGSVVQQVFQDAALESFHGWLMVLAVFAAALVVAGFVARMVRRARPRVR